VKKRTPKKRNNSKYLFFYIVILIFSIDQISKYLGATLDGTTLIPKILNWTYVLNTGAAFGILSGGKYILGIINLIVAGIIIQIVFKNKFNNILTLALSFITGGALGNAYDRLFRIGVIDFLDLGWWPVFNLADSFIIIGIFLLIAMEIKDYLKEK